MCSESVTAPSQQSAISASPNVSGPGGGQSTVYLSLIGGPVAHMAQRPASGRSETVATTAPTRGLLRARGLQHIALRSQLSLALSDCDHLCSPPQLIASPAPAVHCTSVFHCPPSPLASPPPPCQFRFVPGPACCCCLSFYAAAWCRPTPNSQAFSPLCAPQSATSLHPPPLLRPVSRAP